MRLSQIRNTHSSNAQQSTLETLHIHLLVCGGTIDNIDIEKGSCSSTSVIEPYLRDYVKPYFMLLQEQLLMKDSKEITESDRALLAKVVSESPFTRFFVTHGTFSIAETGRYLKRHIDQSSGKLVLLVGLMIPLGQLNSDAPFNLRFACGVLMLLQECGVFIAFNSRIWDPDKVRKNVEELRFGETSMSDKTSG